jgi:hypothetical protein
VYIEEVSATSTSNKVPKKLNVELSSNLGEKQRSKYRIIITNHPAAFGEAQSAKRIAYAASCLGWEWAIVERIDQQPEYLDRLKPNFVISLREEIKPIPGTPHFLYLHVPMFMYLNKDGALSTKAYPNVLAYDGFLSVVPDNKPVKEAYIKSKRQPFFNVNTVLSVTKTEFKYTPKKRLCYWGSTWDKARGSEHYRQLYQLLDKSGYFDIYGPEWSWRKMDLKSYRGMLPLDAHTVVDAISECGIALVLHSHEHIKGSVPTSRIFEAAAASAVIICDPHPFVKEHFSDAVLYIDPNQEPEKVFQQIDQYVKWVHNNPDKAMQLARRAHTIFTERFTLEKELEKIANLYETMIKTKL